MATLFKKGSDSDVSKQIRMKFGRIVHLFLRVITHRLTETDFWYDVTLSRQRPWCHFTKKPSSCSYSEPAARAPTALARRARVTSLARCICSSEISSWSVLHIGVGDGGRGARAPWNSGKIFFGQLLCKIRAFFGQKSCKIWEFCYFFRKNIAKIRVLCSFFGQESCNIRAFG